MTSSSAGRALIADLDSTLVRLAVDWDTLRANLGVERINDLWRYGLSAFEPVAEAERRGAERGEVIAPARAFALQFERIAVLSQNAERALRAFLARAPDVAARCVTIVGRETLGGSKRDFDVFARGVERCISALETEAQAVSYLGDSDYELGFARDLGLAAVDVASLR